MSTSSIDALRINGKHVETAREPAASKTKGNFFKNIRSQFSFSSLRKKNTKKSQTNVQLDKTLEEKRTNRDEEERKLTRSKSFSEKSPASVSSLRPSMTSRPLSEEERKTTPRREQQDFRTAAIKSQQQRWSLAESHLQQHHLQQDHLQQHYLQQQQLNQQQLNLQYIYQQQLNQLPMNLQQLHKHQLQQQQHRHHLANHHRLYPVPHNHTNSYHTEIFPSESQHKQKQQQPRHQPPQQLSLVGQHPSNVGPPQPGSGLIQPYYTYGPGPSQPYYAYGPPYSQSVSQGSCLAETCAASHGESS